MLVESPVVGGYVQLQAVSCKLDIAEATYEANHALQLGLSWQLLLLSHRNPVALIPLTDAIVL